MNEYDYLKFRINEIVNSTDKKKRKLVLYPFGKQGMQIKQILNWQYGIEEAFIIDDGLYHLNSSIKPLEYLKNIDTSQYIFVITSDNLKYWDEIRSNIRKYVKNENIIDMYSFKPLTYSNVRTASLELAAREVYDKNIGGGDVQKRECFREVLHHILMNYFMTESYIYLILLRGFQINI